MGLTLPVPVQYCSLQHRALLSPPDTPTAGHCFCCGPASSFLLELFLHSSPVAYWAPTDWGVHFSGWHVLPFLTVYYIYVVVVQSLSSVCLCDPRVRSPSGSSVLGFSRQVYWSGLPFPPPGYVCYMYSVNTENIYIYVVYVYLYIVYIQY